MLLISTVTSVLGVVISVAGVEGVVPLSSAGVMGGPMTGVEGVVPLSSAGGTGGSMTGVEGVVALSPGGTGGPMTGVSTMGVARPVSPVPADGSMTGVPAMGVTTTGGVMPGTIKFPLAPQLYNLRISSSSHPRQFPPILLHVRTSLTVVVGKLTWPMMHIMHISGLFWKVPAAHL